jgi:uncharacterized OB-fold protein
MTTTSASTEVMGAMHAQLTMPYTLTPGRAMGTFLAELANRRILGSHCDQCNTTRVPAQDFCGTCSEPTPGFVQVPDTGSLQAWTVTDQGTIALVLLDGSDVALLHRVMGVEPEGLTVGARLAAVWVDEPQGSILDIEGFSPADGAPQGAVETAGETAAAVEQVDYRMVLDFQHAYGHFYGSLFDGIKHDRRIRGVRCPSCRNVLVPPRAYCEACYVPTMDWIDVPDTGVVQACSVVHVEFKGQRVPPPYVYAEIVLDGTSTRLIHTVGGVSVEDARAGMVRPGSRVKAVWSDRRTGSLTDIDYFAVIDDRD